jgi:hypothetical protein
LVDYPFSENQKLISCYSPKYNLAYGYYSKSHISFSYNKETCGTNCEFNGKNCEEGICNIDECPVGYKHLYYGMCKNDRGDKLLVYDRKNNKFHNKKTLEMKNNIKEASRTTAFVATMPLWLMYMLYECKVRDHCF